MQQEKLAAQIRPGDQTFWACHKIKIRYPDFIARYTEHVRDMMASPASPVPVAMQMAPPAAIISAEQQQQFLAWQQQQQQFGQWQQFLLWQQQQQQQMGGCSTASSPPLAASRNDAITAATPPHQQEQIQSQVASQPATAAISQGTEEKIEPAKTSAATTDGTRDSSSSCCNLFGALDSASSQVNNLNTSGAKLQASFQKLGQNVQSLLGMVKSCSG
jgi:hypothetical protein